MENSTFYMVMIMSLPAVLVAAITAMNAKKTNAAWRARRDSRSQRDSRSLAKAAGK